MFFITVYAGSGLIANDRRANALQIYLSKPLTRVEYVVRQAGHPAGVPAVRHLGARRSLLLIVQVMFAGSFDVLPRQPLPVPGDHAVFAFIQALTVSAAMLALSSLSKSSRYVGILYAGVIFFTPGDVRRALRR